MNDSHWAWNDLCSSCELRLWSAQLQASATYSPHQECQIFLFPFLRSNLWTTKRNHNINHISCQRSVSTVKCSSNKSTFIMPSVLWHCWLGIRKSIWPVKTEWWGVGVVSSMQGGAHCLHMVQLMLMRPKNPLSLVSFKSRLVLPFWYRLIQVVLEKRSLNGCSSSSSNKSMIITVIPGPIHTVVRVIFARAMNGKKCNYCAGCRQTNYLIQWMPLIQLTDQLTIINRWWGG